MAAGTMTMVGGVAAARGPPAGRSRMTAARQEAAGAMEVEEGSLGTRRRLGTTIGGRCRCSTQWVSVA